PRELWHTLMGASGDDITPFAMTPLRFALYGPGLVARYHQVALAATDGAELTTVVHPDPTRHAALADAFGVPACTEGQVLADPTIDAVILCTPSGQHAAQALRAAQAGKHVLVEKPMALTRADADAMIAACDRAGVALGVVYQRRAVAPFTTLAEAVSLGDLGDPTLATVVLPYRRDQAYYDQAAWRGTWAHDGGGVLMNQGIHLIDLLVWCFGDPVAVQAQGATLARAVEVEDTMVATLRFGSGALATVTATTTADPGFAHRFEVYGTRGGVQIQGERVIASSVEAVMVEPRAVGHPGAGGSAGGIEADGHIAVMHDFVEAIRTGRAPLMGGREGRRSLEVVLSIYEAAGLR
ncbi:MAG: Gfo/Idh/MocA family oxidoreductase, partial [Bacteroidota bacterium]